MARLIALGLVALLGVGCATTDDPYDPYQSANRKVHGFNEGADKYLLRPVAMGWKFLLPRVVKKHLNLFFLHIAFPRNFLNDLLQAEVNSPEWNWDASW